MPTYTSTGYEYVALRKCLTSAIKDALRSEPGVLAPFGAEERISDRIVTDITSTHLQDIKRLSELLSPTGTTKEMTLVVEATESDITHD